LIFKVHAAVLNDCAQHRMFSVWTASKRLSIRLPSAADLRFVNAWMTVLDLYEVDLLPLRNSLSARSLMMRLRRWREPVEMARLVLRRLILREPFSVRSIYPAPSQRRLARI
jgi:hypothetical protein